MAKQVVSVRISDELLDRAQKIADRTGESRSECIERLIAVGADSAADAHRALDSTFLGRLASFVLESPSLMKLLFSDLKPSEYEALRERLKHIKSSRGTNRKEEK